jgi:hypothetical protein
MELGKKLKGKCLESIDITCQYLENRVCIKIHNKAKLYPKYMYINPHMSFNDILEILDNIHSYVLIEVI